MVRVAGAVLAGITLMLAGTASARADTTALWSVPLSGGAGGGRSAGPPAAPTGLTAGCLVPAGTVGLSWTSVPSANSYTVYQSGSSSGPYRTIGTTSSATFTVTSLTVGTYWFTVRAQQGPNWSSASSTGAAVTLTAALLCA